MARDARITTNLPARSYILALAQYDIGSLQPIEKSVYQTANSFIAKGGFLQAETGRFNVANPYDQIFFGFAWNGPYEENDQPGSRFFGVFEVDSSNETLSLKSSQDFSALVNVSNFSIGNSDKKTTDSSGKTQPAFGLQVALIGCPIDCGPLSFPEVWLFTG